jgi:hypothetical protein
LYYNGVPGLSRRGNLSGACSYFFWFSQIFADFGADFRRFILNVYSTDQKSQKLSAQICEKICENPREIKENQGVPSATGVKLRIRSRKNTPAHPAIHRLKRPSPAK